jgi:ParB family chromosome partitioning protein
VARRGLGRGIEALIPGDDSPSGGSIVELNPREIEVDPLQPRQTFDDSKMDELAASLKEHGVIQPLIVRQAGDGYRLVAGERRLRAAVKAGIERIPVVVRNLDDRQAVEVSLVENLQREELGPLEQAGAFQRLADEFGLTQEEIAARVGKSRPEVANTMRLLKLEPEVKKFLVEGKLTSGHGRALVSLDREKQMKLAKMAVRRGLSVRRTEELVSAEARKAQSRSSLSRTIRRKDAEELLSSALGSPVQVRVQGPRGSIAISFFGEEDLERLVEIVQKGTKA